MIAVVMEECMKNPRTWGGEVAMVLGGRLYVDMTGSVDPSTVTPLYDKIIQIIGTPLQQFIQRVSNGTEENVMVKDVRDSNDDNEEGFYDDIGNSNDDNDNADVTTHHIPPRDHMLHDMQWTPYTLGAHNPSAYSTGWVCDLCRKKSTVVGGTWAEGRFHCPIDSADICKTCYLAIGADVPPTDTKGHSMPFTRYVKGSHNKKGYSTGWRCDKCERRSIEKSEQWGSGRFHCPQDDADYCMDCAYEMASK